MMKNTNHIACFLAAITAWTSCSNDQPVPVQQEEQEITTKVEIALPEVFDTRATKAPSSFSDPSLTDVDVTLFVSYKGKITQTITKEDQDFSRGRKVEFQVRLVSGQTYDISAWADFGKGYYDLHTTVGDSAYAVLNSSTIKSLQSDIDYNKYDAYFGNIRESISITKTLSMTLKRPFALVQVNTLDWDEAAVKEAGIRPDNYLTTFNVPTKMKLIDGSLSDVKDVTVAAYVSQYDQEAGGLTTPKALSFDYLLADNVSALLPDFTIKYMKATEDVTSYVFKNIPIQRNYKTIITGNILTKEGTIEVAVDSAWCAPDMTIIQ